MTDERATTTRPAADVATLRSAVESRRPGELARPDRRTGGPIAVYDTVTEGMTGWRFLRTGRWFGFAAAAVLFAIICVFLANWQLDRGRQASSDNAIVSANFAAAPIPLEQALPTLDSYSPTQNWQRVSATGVYLANDQLVVRNRSNGGDNGFEVVTPLQLADGSIFMIDRGWVAPSADDPLSPAPIPAPAGGTVSVNAQLQPSEPQQGSGAADGGQIQSITLPGIQQKIGGRLYTGAYGVLVSQTPAAASGLVQTQTAMPTEDVGTHYSYTIQWLFFAVLGFVGLTLAARREFRLLNSDDPDERERALMRWRKRAAKPFTDEELEDEAIDGYLPLSRWSPPAAPSAPQPRAISQRPPNEQHPPLDD